MPAWEQWRTESLTIYFPRIVLHSNNGLVFLCHWLSDYHLEKNTDPPNTIYSILPDFVAINGIQNPL